MSASVPHESWILYAGDTVIQKMAADGISSLSPIEKLIYCVWAADYSMRNAGNLNAARDLYVDFQTEAVRLAKGLKLPITLKAFALPTTDLEEEYFGLFGGICNELRCVQRN